LTRAGKSLRDLQVVLELGSNEAIKVAVRRGLGAAVLSTSAVREQLRSETLRALPVAGLRLVRELFAVWDRRRVLPIPARRFLDLLVDPSSSDPS
jgi:DNA-binding transcriptional LysR family regulator